MLRITQLNIRIGIKNGLSFDDFCTKYQCTREELEHVITNIYRFDAKKVIAEIDKNSKKGLPKRNHQSKGTGGMQTLEDLHSTTSPGGGSGMQTLEDLHSTTSPGGASTSEMDQLKATEAELSSTVINLESLHKQLVQEHHENLTQLYQIQNQLKAIRQNFQEVSQQYEKLVVCNNELVRQIDSVNSRHANKQSELQDVRQKIKDLEVITLCIYADGKIEPMDAEDVSLDESGNEGIYHSLISQQTAICQDLRLRDISILARLSAIIINSTRHFNLLFEDTDLEQQYYQLP